MVQGQAVGRNGVQAASAEKGLLAGRQFSQRIALPAPQAQAFARRGRHLHPGGVVDRYRPVAGMQGGETTIGGEVTEMPIRHETHQVFRVELVVASRAVEGLIPLRFHGNFRRQALRENQEEHDQNHAK